MTSKAGAYLQRFERAERRRRRLDFGQLEQLVAAPSTAELCRRLGVQRDVLLTWRRSGVTVDQADELATVVGLHPLNVWPDW